MAKTAENLCLGFWLLREGFFAKVSGRLKTRDAKFSDGLFILNRIYLFFFVRFVFIFFAPQAFKQCTCCNSTKNNQFAEFSQ